MLSLCLASLREHADLLEARLSVQTLLCDYVVQVFDARVSVLKREEVVAVVQEFVLPAVAQELCEGITSMFLQYLGRVENATEHQSYDYRSHAVQYGISSNSSSDNIQKRGRGGRRVIRS